MDIFRDAVDKMVDRSCDEETLAQMTQVILDQPGVLGLDLLQTRLFGAKIYVDAEIDHGPRVGEHPRQKFSRGEDEIHRHTDQGDPHGQALGLLGGEGRFCFGRLGLQGNTPP